MQTYSQSIISWNKSKASYAGYSALAKVLIQKGGIIFGGFVRDKLIHDDHATRFYQKEGEDCDYSDSTVYPETAPRLTVPKDIDVFFRLNESEVETLFHEIAQEHSLHVTIYKRVPVYFEKLEISHFKAHFHLLNDIFSIPSCMLTVDILCKKDEDIEPPFGRCDLMCNALLLDKRGIRLSRSIGDEQFDNMQYTDHKLLEWKTISELLSLSTDVVFSQATDLIRLQRIFSMQLRGWTILGTPSYNIIRDGDCPVKVELKCCDVLMSTCEMRDCLSSETGPRCPACAREIDLY